MKHFFTFFTFFFIIFASSSQTQLGNDLNGDAAGDFFGFSTAISSNGSRIVIGALYNDNNGNNAGQVRVYDWDGNDWVQAGGDLTGEAAFDSFGYAVSISSDGTRIAVGAEFNDDNGSNSGHVRVFDWDGNHWIQVGNDIDGEAAGDRFGRAVCLSGDGNLIAIGADFNDGNGSNSGHTRIYDWNGNNWIQVGNDIDGEAAGDRSGGDALSLSSDGNIIAIGAPENQGNGLDAGHVRIYNWDGSTWTQMGADIDGENTGDGYGDAISLSSAGTRVAIGTYLNDDNGTNAGYVNVFDWNGSNWVEIGNKIYGESAGDISGEGIALSSDGNRIVIGSRGNNSNGISSGHARIFDWNGNDWIQVGVPMIGENQGDGLGWSVSLSSNGNRVALGSISNDDNGTSSGQVRVYDLSTVTLGIDQITNSDNISVYPNPTSDIVIVDELISVNKLSIFDIKGQLIKKIIGKNRINMSSLNSGLFLLRIETSEKRIHYRKVIKK